jgi:hypothetical protein
MVKIRCVHAGQVEAGVIAHHGREFWALGSSVCGRHITGYTSRQGLTSSCGKTMLVCRQETIADYYSDAWGDSYAIVYRLTRGRFIVGCALGLKRMVFRGELVTDCDFAEACYQAKANPERCIEMDAEDEERYPED